MNKLFKPFKTLLALLFLVQLSAVAQDDDYEKDKKQRYEFVKTKSFNKTYNVSSSDKLSIQNSFGSVKIETWNRNEIKVDVSIEASSNVASVAQTMIDRISISESQTNGNVSIKTNMKSMNNDSKGDNDKTTMHINYVVSMPAGNPLNVTNEFGSITVPDMTGEVNLTSKFGKLTAGVLPNVGKILVEFGKANIASVSNAEVVSKYSGLTIGKMNGNIKMNVEFSTKVQLNYNSSLTGLDLKASYSNINLRPSGDPAVNYNISTSFGSVKNRTGVKLDSDEDDDERGPKFDHQYNGKSGSGTIPVTIKSSFTSIVLGEPSADDLKNKNKNKDKSKTS